MLKILSDSFEAKALSTNASLQKSLFFSYRKVLKSSLIVVSIITMSTTACLVQAQGINDVIQQGVQRTDKAQQDEQQIKKIDSQLQSKQQIYSGLLKENEGLSVYIKQLEKQIEGQRKESEKIELAIVQSAQMERQIIPLMLRMTDSLESLVKVDLPFKKQDRLQKIESLKATIDRSDVSVAEKYRKVLEMYQNEINYGRSIEAYRDEIEIEGQKQQVDILRIGRLALIYQSLNGENIGSWDQQANTWQNLESAYKSKVEQAIRIAREQAAPALIKIPLTLPKS